MKGNSSKFLALLLSASMIMSPTASVLADTQEKAAQTESSAAAEEAPQSEETAETAFVTTPSKYLFDMRSGRRADGNTGRACRGSDTGRI